MFRMGLLTSTAMTAVTLLLSGAPTGAYAQTDMHVADRDANARFLCTYGQFEVTFSSVNQSGSRRFDWEHVAVPITGHGQTVSRIIVMEGRNPRTPRDATFSAGIYSNNKKGFPGKLIANGTGSAGSSCGPVTINIPPTTLMARTKYWVEEKTKKHHNPSGAAYISFAWYTNPKTKHKAYVQTGAAECSIGVSCYKKTHSPWTEQTTGPWFRLK